MTDNAKLIAQAREWNARLVVYWCPLCHFQTQKAWHSLRDGGLFPQSDTEHECVELDVSALAATLEAAEAQIARLRKERDDAHTEWAAMQATATRHRERAEAAEARATDAEHGRELARLDAENERRLNRIGGDDEGGMWQPPGFWRERALAAEAQRDTLAEALRQIAARTSLSSNDPLLGPLPPDIARAALSAVEPPEACGCGHPLDAHDRETGWCRICEDDHASNPNWLITDEIRAEARKILVNFRRPYTAEDLRAIEDRIAKDRAAVAPPEEQKR